jgi:hypothetical protein
MNAAFLSYIKKAGIGPRLEVLNQVSTIPIADEFGEFAAFSRQCNMLGFRHLRADRILWRRTGKVINMGELEHFVIRDGYAVFRPTGQISIEGAVDLVTRAIAFARERKIQKLLINISNLTGFESPSVARRYFFVHDWARAAAGVVCVALVTGPEMVDRKKFGVTVAANFGLAGDVFTTEEEALIWLHRVK